MEPPLPATIYPGVVGKALFLRTLIEIAFGVWVVLALRYPVYRAPRSRLPLVLAAFVAVSFLSSFFGVSFQHSLWSTYARMQGLVDLAHWFAFTWILTSVFRSWTHWRALLNISLGASLVVGLLGLAEDFSSEAKRLSSTLGNPTFLGGYALVNTLIALGFLSNSYLRPGPPGSSRAMERARRRGRAREAAEQTVFPLSENSWRAFWAAVIVLDAWMLYRSGTRGALIGLTAGLVAVASGYMIWGREKRLRLVLLALIVTLPSLIVVLVAARSTGVFGDTAGSGDLFSRMAKVGSGDASVTSRVTIAAVGIRAFAARPILGWGQENFDVAYDRHLTANVEAFNPGLSSSYISHSHNKIVDELVTKGVLGLLSYMFVWIYMAWVIVRRVETQGARDQVFNLFVGGALIGYFVQNLFLFDTPGTATCFYLLVGYVAHLDAGNPDIDSSRASKARGRSGTANGARGLILNSDTSITVALAVAGAFVLVAIYALNYRAYEGARADWRANYEPMAWEKRLAVFDEAIVAFPPLAFTPRLEMFDQLIMDFDRLSDPEARAALDAVDRESRHAQTSDPERFRVYESLASFYQKASRLDPAYAEKARALVEKARELAPERIRTQVLLARQHIAEKDYEGAHKVIDDYIERSPYTDANFRSLRSAIDEAAGR